MALSIVQTTVLLSVNYAVSFMLVVAYKPFMLNVVMVSVIGLNVVALGEVSLSP